MGLAATGTPDAEARTILIVEDERIVARDLCMTLEEMGYVALTWRVSGAPLFVSLW